MDFTQVHERCRYSTFVTKSGCEEHYITISTPETCDLREALASLEASYDAALRQARLGDDTAVFNRLFVSDLINQRQLLEDSAIIKRLRTRTLSIIEQKPLGGGPLAFFSWHISKATFGAHARQCACSGQSGANAICHANLLGGKNYSLLVTAHCSNSDVFDAYRQTDAIFKGINATIEQSGMTLLDNTIRTWIFVRDIDNHYADMVRARREYFADHGLTDKTRYLASTGIEGGSYEPRRLVAVDSLSIGGLKPGQIVRMEAPQHMSPTILYGVTFERGLRVRFGDRSHLYVSGTASIDQKGEVLFIGDVAGQTRRTVENLRALLAEQGASIGDMAYIICYVRTFHDWGTVRKVLNAEISNEIPIIPVEAKVCRPAWLFELEGVAILPEKNEFAPFI